MSQKIKPPRPNLAGAAFCTIFFLFLTRSSQADGIIFARTPNTIFQLLLHAPSASASPVQENIIERLRQGLLSDSFEEKQATRRVFRQLAVEDHSQFIKIWHILLKDSEIRIRHEVFLLLARLGDQDDPIAEAAAQEALSIPELQYSALLALGRVGTAETVPLLFEYARHDLEHPEDGEHYKIALVCLAKQVRTVEQKQQALHLARESLLSKHYRSRDVALRALNILSTPAAEEELLLKAYRMYYDELVIWALGAASPQMLPILYELLAAVEPKYAEHGEILCAIQRMESRMKQGKEADPGKPDPSLSDYL